MGIVDKVIGGLGGNAEARKEFGTNTTTGGSSGVTALADGKPSEVIIDDRIGGTHTRNDKDAVTHENINRHAHHEVEAVVNRNREEVEIHQKIQPVLDEQRSHSHHQHSAPVVQSEKIEDFNEADAARYRSQGQHEHTRQVGEQTHSTSVNAPKIHEHVDKHIVEEIQPVIERQTHHTEHHHTVQQINEHVVHAPVVHETTVNAPISMAEFGQGNAGASHGAREVMTGQRN